MSGVNTGSSWIYGGIGSIRTRPPSVQDLPQYSRYHSRVANPARRRSGCCAGFVCCGLSPGGRFGDAGAADPRGPQSHVPTVPCGLLQPPHWGKRAVSAMAGCLQDGERDRMSLTDVRRPDQAAEDT